MCNKCGLFLQRWFSDCVTVVALQNSIDAVFLVACMNCELTSVEEVHASLSDEESWFCVVRTADMKICIRYRYGETVSYHLIGVVYRTSFCSTMQPQT